MAIEGYNEEGSDMIEWFTEEMETRKNRLDTRLFDFVARLRNEKEIHHYIARDKRRLGGGRLDSNA